MEELIIRSEGRLLFGINDRFGEWVTGLFSALSTPERTHPRRNSRASCKSRHPCGNGDDDFWV